MHLNAVHVCADDPTFATEDLEEALGAALRTWTAPLRDLTIDPERDFDDYISSLGSVIKPEAAPSKMPPLASSDLDGVDSLTPRPPAEAPWADFSTNF